MPVEASNFQSGLSDALTQVDNAFGEPSSTGLNTALGQFFNSFNDLANNPSDLGIRATTIQQGAALSSVFQGVQQQLTAVSSTLTAHLSSDIQTVNDYGKQIAALNVTLRQNGGSNQPLNGVLDRRDLLLDKLSALTNISTQNNADGTVSISIGNAALVVGTDAYTVTQSSLTSGNSTNGEIAGLNQAQADVAGYQGQLNTLAASLVSQVNAVHRAGAGLDGSSGLNFFTATAGNEAATLGVNQTLVDHPEKLAAAAVPVPPASPLPPQSDGSNAIQIASLKNLTVTDCKQPAVQYIADKLLSAYCVGCRRTGVQRQYRADHRLGEPDPIDPAARFGHRCLHRCRNGEHDEISARLPGISAIHSDHGQHDRNTDHWPVLSELVRKAKNLCVSRKASDIDRLQQNINTSLNNLNTIQSQISSGKKLTDFADDPAGASQAMALHSAIDDTTQYQRDADSAKTYLSAADTALSSVTTIVQSARQIALQGANSNQSPESLTALSSQVDGIIQQVSQLANSDLHGTYLFGGTQTKNPPFDSSQNYQGDTQPLNASIGPGYTVQTSTVGSAVFGPTFTALQSLKQDLASAAAGTVGALNNVSSDVTKIDSGLTAISAAQATVGAKINQVDLVTQRLTRAQTEYSDAISKIEDVNLATAYVQLQSAQNVYQASLSTTAKAFQYSLADFIH